MTSESNGITERPTPEQIAERSSLWDIRDIGPEIVVADIRAAGYVIVHPDDVLDWIERLSENPLGTPIYSTLTPSEAAADFMERFNEREPT